VHRFGITFHRQQRSKGTFYNELENIHGIGKTTAENLLKQFKSVQKIKELSKEELIKEVGNARANLIWKYFHAVKDNATQVPNQTS
jgi:excinuclease ABC subunit C